MILGNITSSQMEQIYQTMAKDVGLDCAMMTENAGYLIAHQAQAMIKTLPGTPIVILAGAGGNGTDAIAGGRRLAAWGARVTILLAKPPEQTDPQGQIQLQLAEQFGVRVYEPGAFLPPAELVIDGLIGYNGRGTPRGTTSDLITEAGKFKVPILAVDVPSGLDATTGKADQPVIRADVTLTLGYPKTGLIKDFAKNLVGKLLLGDISIPPSVWIKMGLTAPDFSNKPIIEV